MKVSDILQIVGAVLLTLGPEIRTEGKTTTAYWIGRSMQAVGAALLASRAAKSLSDDIRK